MSDEITTTVTFEKVTQMSRGRALLTRYADGGVDLANDATVAELRGLVYAFVTDQNAPDSLPASDRAELRDFTMMLSTGQCPYCAMPTKRVEKP